MAPCPVLKEGPDEGGEGLGVLGGSLFESADLGWEGWTAQGGWVADTVARV
jgi:hypothetical protein